ncbi:MAG: hypothetical protein IJX01_05865 [Oscillospiraceae bacterium]|nr:hypothetical protein [Oscillospiraceae bacterium]
MNITNYPSINSEELFSDVASIDIYMKVANYFGIDYDDVFSVYSKSPNRYEGEVALFAYREPFFFELLEIDDVFSLTKLESVSLSR